MQYNTIQICEMAAYVKSEFYSLCVNIIYYNINIKCEIAFIMYLLNGIC